MVSLEKGENYFCNETDNKCIFVTLVAGDIIRRVNDLRKKNPHLSTLISVGGGSDGSSKYSEMCRSSANRKTFIHSVVEFLTHHNLNGL